ncbi:MAG: T9SS type A sorting domain-containing protein [Bacteroidota bacterium]
MKRYNILMIMLLILGSSMQAQSLEKVGIVSAGDIAEADNVVLTYTVGQVLDEVVSNGSISLVPGFSAAGELTVSVDDLLVGVEFQLYPNPTQEELSLSLRTDKRLSLAADIVSLNGQQIADSYQNWEMAAGMASVQEFEVSKLPTGTYVLRLLAESTQEVLKVFKFQVVR